MRSLRLQQGKILALLFAGYGALYFCRADLSVGAPLAALGLYDLQLRLERWDHNRHAED